MLFERCSIIRRVIHRDKLTLETVSLLLGNAISTTALQQSFIISPSLKGFTFWLEFQELHNLQALQNLIL
jgi:hypothetical protein